MKRNVFYVCLVLAAALFAVVSLGGCGGSSSSSGGSGGGGEADESSMTMGEVWQDDEAAAEVVNRLNSGDVFLLLTVRMEAVEKKPDGSVTMKYYDMADSVFHDADSPEVPYNAAELKAHYDSGDVIVITNADLELVNTVRADVGLAPEDESNFGESGRLEAYGLSCQRVNGLRNLFTYVVPRMGDMLYSEDVKAGAADPEADTSADGLLASQDSVPEKPEVTQDEYTLRDFQIDRWVHFLQWMGQLGVMSLRNAAFASDYTVRAAANDDLTAIADAQTKTFNFSYSNKMSPTYNLFSNRYQYRYSRSRNNFVSVTIYSAHSFSSGKDYYVVQSNTTTVPRNFNDTYIEWNDYKRNVLYGFTRSAATEHHIDGGEMSTGDVSLVKHTPVNVNPSKSYSEGMEWEINGKVGVNKDGVAAEIGGGVKFSKSVSWSVSEYDLINDSMKEHPASAKWYVSVQGPDDGDRHYVGAPFIYYKGVNAKGASTRQIQYDTYFMWEVGKNYWNSHPNIRMYVKFNVEDGFCMGWCNQGFKEYNRYDEQDSWSDTQSITLQQPAHTAISQRTFAFTSRAATAQQFTLLAEDSWNISGVPSWLHFTETSGNATGSTDKLLLFDVDENTSSSPRTAKLTLKSGRDTITLEVAQSGK